MEPAAVLVVAFQVQVGFRALDVEGWPVICVLMAATQDMFKGAAGVEPHFQNVSALAVTCSVIAGLVQDLFARHTAPGFDATPRHNVRGLVQYGHGTRVQLAAVLVQEEGHRHPPTALA